ncbi:interleukin-6 receptor subunit beta-like isoform X1 [Sebastes fasciatus]|uniref:interleukin-6 receptor subunit beta-like isoform X1 n=1 Tax=Sebastes fasciatus TaxID=394691 RepID=UPI003D9F9B27
MHLSVALFILAAISICKGRLENNCNVFPKDKYIEVGSDIDIECQTSCVKGKIFWTLNNVPVDERLSNTINSSHTVLSLRKFTHHSAILQCHSAVNQQVLGGTNIRTYSKPSNISCILHSKDQDEGIPDLFTCNWEHQINPSLEVNYTILRSTRSNSSKKKICTSHRTECTNHSVEIFENNSITVRAETAHWTADSDPREFDPLHIWKIVPSKSLNVETFSDRVLVKWNRASSGDPGHCQVNYSKAANEQTTVVLHQNLTKGQHGKMPIDIAKFESCSNYSFSVRCALIKAPWSDWSHKTTVLTQLNKSHVKLRLWRKVAEPEKNGVRRVHAMWTEIPSTCKGTFTYAVKSTPYKEHTIGVNCTLRGKLTCDVDVSRDAHRINLTVFHDESLFVEDSVYVPAIRESLPQVTDIQTSTLEGVILVSWKAPIQSVSCYMVDWTHDGNQYHWKESKYTNATLSDLLDKKPYNITVTPLFENKTSHGTQALHICSRFGGPGNVTIHVQTNDKSALVSWNVTSQEACSGAVVNYTVFYGEPPLNDTLDGSKQDTSLKDLIPDTYYSVYVKATALTGTTESIVTSFKTNRFGPGLITAVSVVGSIIIVLVLSLGLCCTVQWQKFRAKPVPNPRLASAVTLWPTAGRQEGMFQAFSNPTESLCDRVYTEEAQRKASSPIDCYGNPASDQTDDYVDSAMTPIIDEKHEDPVDPVETPRLSSPDDSTALLSAENSPYRSQSSVESPASKCSKQCKRVPLKQTMYVTLDMLEQHGAR